MAFGVLSVVGEHLVSEEWSVVLTECLGDGGARLREVFPEGGGSGDRGTGPQSVELQVVHPLLFVLLDVEQLVDLVDVHLSQEVQRQVIHLGVFYSGHQTPLAPWDVHADDPVVSESVVFDRHDGILSPETHYSLAEIPIHPYLIVQEVVDATLEVLFVLELFDLELVELTETCLVAVSDGRQLHVVLLVQLTFGGH